MKSFSASTLRWQVRKDSPRARRLALKGRSDVQLLADIKQRSEQAFVALYNRYKRPAHALAYRITGHSDLSEEAVQEAFIRVWSSAHRFKEDGNPRGWLLRIVANESLGLLKSRRRREDLEEKAKGIPGQVQMSPTNHPYETEAYGQLNRSLARLPEMARQIISLYFGANLSQREIGEMLGLPQSTVSMKLKDSLSNLRSGLIKAGFTTSVPLMGSEVLSQVILKGVRTPEGLVAPVSSLQGPSAFSAARGSKRVEITPTTKGAILFVVLSVCAATGLGVLLAGRIGDSVKIPVSEITRPASQAPPYSRYWSFNESQSTQGLEVKKGKWNHQPTGGVGNSGYMALEARQEFEFSVPLDRKSFPLQIDLNVLESRFSTKRFVVHLMWPSHPRHLLIDFGNLTKLTRQGRWLPFRFIVSETGIDSWQGELHQFLALPTQEHFECETDPIEVSITGISGLDELTVKSAEKSDWVEPATYRRAISTIPVVQRFGCRLLPGIRTSNTYKPVLVRFVPEGKGQPFGEIRIPSHSTFDQNGDGIPFEWLKGGLHWVEHQGSNGSGCVATIDDHSIFQIPFYSLNRPLKISWRSKLVETEAPKSMGLQQRIVYSRFKRSTVIENLNEGALRPPKWQEYSCIVWDDFIEHYLDGRRTSLCRFEFGDNERLICIVFRGKFLMDNLKIEYLPGPLKEGQARFDSYRKILDAIPLKERATPFSLPHWPDGPNGKKVYATFQQGRNVQVGNAAE